MRAADPNQIVISDPLLNEVGETGQIPIHDQFHCLRKVPEQVNGRLIPGQHWENRDLISQRRHLMNDVIRADIAGPQTPQRQTVLDEENPFALADPVFARQNGVADMGRLLMTQEILLQTGKCLEIAPDQAWDPTAPELPNSRCSMTTSGS